MIILAMPSAMAENLQYLDHSELALARLYHDISKAESTIDMTYHLLDPCSSVSKVLMKKLHEKTHPKKASNGLSSKPVKVRLLVDARNFMPNIGAAATYFASLGIEIKFFNPNNLPLGGNDHTHSKMTLIDKDVPGKSRLITGGRNLADEYFGMSDQNFVDRDVAVEGPSSKEDKNGTMAQAESGFEQLWSSRLAKKEAATPPIDEADFQDCTRWTKQDAQLEQYLKASAEKLIAQEQPVSCQNVSFTIDSMKHIDFQGLQRLKDGTEVPDPLAFKPTSRVMYDFLYRAKHSLTMENQYFIPDDDYLKNLLRQKREQGVRIDLYSNMFESDGPLRSIFDDRTEFVEFWHRHYMQKENVGSQTNHMNFHVAGLMDRWKFTPDNAKYAYHAKVFVADGKNAIVSSFNIDPRSMKINGESALRVTECPAFAQKVEGVAKLTGKVWTQEEKFEICSTGRQPEAGLMDPLTALVEVFTKELQ